MHWIHMASFGFTQSGGVFFGIPLEIYFKSNLNKLVTYGPLGLTLSHKGEGNGSLAKHRKWKRARVETKHSRSRSRPKSKLHIQAPAKAQKENMPAPAPKSSPKATQRETKQTKAIVHAGATLGSFFLSFSKDKAPWDYP